MKLIVFFMGIAAMIVPLLYALVMVAVWASVKDARRRRIVLTIMAVVAALQIFNVTHSLSAGRRHAKQLEAFCQPIQAAQSQTRPREAGQVFFDFDLYSLAKGDSATQYGRLAFSADMVSRTLLRGVDAYDTLVYRNGGAYETVRVDPNGQDLRDRITQRPTSGVTLTWEADEAHRVEGLENIRLVIKDTRTAQTLATQSVHVLYEREVRAFPSIAAAPTILRRERIRSCPMPVELARLIKTVAPPATRPPA